MIGIDSQSGMSAEVAEVAEFTYSGGGSVNSDTFSCDSIFDLLP